MKCLNRKTTSETRWHGLSLIIGLVAVFLTKQPHNVVVARDVILNQH